MTILERIETLQIASNHDIKVVRCWWSYIHHNVQWTVLKSRKKLSYNQYFYLSNNKLLQEKEVLIEGESVILTISEVGKAKLASLQKIQSNKKPVKTRKFHSVENRFGFLWFDFNNKEHHRYIKAKDINQACIIFSRVKSNNISHLDYEVQYNNTYIDISDRKEFKEYL